MNLHRWWWPAALVAVALVGAAAPGSAQRVSTIGDLVVHEGDVPRRLVGYGLVVGLDGTGDRSFGAGTAGTPTVRSVVNLLRRFGVEVPPEQMRLRNVAAVLVTAEMSPYLRAGGRFDVQVAALGDALSLRGGVLWMTPLVSDPDAAPVATAQGALMTPTREPDAAPWRRGNAARITDGGVMEVDPPVPATATVSRLLLRQPDLRTAQRIAESLNAAYGDSTARVVDPGVVAVRPPAGSGGFAFAAALDTLGVSLDPLARVVVDARTGTVVAGGALRVGPAVVAHNGITLRIGGPSGSAADNVLALAPSAPVQEVAAGLHALGAAAGDIAAVFEALRAAGALRAEVVIR